MVESSDADGSKFDLLAVLKAKGVPEDTAKEINEIAEAHRLDAVVSEKKHLEEKILAIIEGAVADGRIKIKVEQKDQIASHINNFLISFSASGAFWLYQDWLVQMKSLFMAEPNDQILGEMQRTAEIRDSFRSGLSVADIEYLDNNCNYIELVEEIFKEEVKRALGHGDGSMRPWASVISFNLSNEVFYSPLESSSRTGT